MRNSLAGLAIVMLGALLAAPGCGDNSRACGPGTLEEDGFCVPSATCGFGTKPHEETGECIPDGSLVCSDGTVFDVLTGSCKIDEAACQNGTVLVEDACVDPTAGLVIDVQEGPEPNGLGVIEASEAQAGNIVLDVSKPFVIHGTIDPHRDTDNDGVLDPDVDTFVLTTGEPAFVKITADGVNGAAAGFVALSVVDPGDPLEGWKRVGMSLVSDTAVREVYLPQGGTYRLAVADTRTLVDFVTTGDSTTAPGSDTSEYYVSLATFTPPAPTPLALVDGRVTTTRTKPSDRLALFSVPLGTGLNVVDLSMPSALVDEALVLQTGGVFRTAVGAAGNTPPRAIIGDLDAGEEAVIIVDHVYTLLPTTATFTLGVVSKDATPMSRSGGTVSSIATTSIGTDFTYLNLFSFEVSADDTTMGMNLTISPQVVGQIYDSIGRRAAAFTTPPSASTWSSYRGLVRLRKAGRYYFAVYAPSASSTTSLDMASTMSELPPTTVVQGTPLTAGMNTFSAVPFLYPAGTMDAWQQFDVTGVNTGGQTVSWLDPALAYGRLDRLTTSTGTLASEVTPIFTRTFAAAGGAVGRVLLSDPTLDYLVKVNATAQTTSPTVTLTFARRGAMVDMGAFMAGTTTSADQSIDSTTPQRFYLFQTPIGKTATITVTPTSNVNTQFRRLNADETPLGALINTTTNGADVETFVQAGTGWTAFVVSAAGPLSQTRTFDVSVQIQ